MQARKKPIDMKKASPRVPQLVKLNLEVAPSKSTGAEILGNGVDAVPALVDVLKKIGTL